MEAGVGRKKEPSKVLFEKLDKSDIREKIVAKASQESELIQWKIEIINPDNKVIRSCCFAILDNEAVSVVEETSPFLSVPKNINDIFMPAELSIVFNFKQFVF